MRDVLPVPLHAAFVEDALALVDAEVEGKRGATGLAVRAGYGAVNRLNPDLVRDAMVALLPELVDRLDPHWRDYTDAGSETFGDHLAARSDDVAEELLTVTDERIDGSSMQAVKRVYATMRPAAKRHVVEALPRVGGLIERYAA
ncbi:MAG: hypothetical protein ICV72_09700 [Aldersonia sp.]|nr:hypothetical protein [Aldersonia sp.]